MEVVPALARFIHFAAGIMWLGLLYYFTFVQQPALQAATVVVAVVVGGISLAWLPGLALRPVVRALPPVVQMIGGFLVFDFLVYWAHRWGGRLVGIGPAGHINVESGYGPWIEGRVLFQEAVRSQDAWPGGDLPLDDSSHGFLRHRRA